MTRADVIFAGTVVRSTPERLENTIVTQVTFEELRFVKGRQREKIQLTLWGGMIGNRGSVVESMPEFTLGQRYIVCTYSDLGSAKNYYIPIVGLYLGFFPILRDTITNREYVANYAGRPIVDITDRFFLAVSPDEVLPGTQFDEDVFLRALQELADTSNSLKAR